MAKTSNAVPQPCLKLEIAVCANGSCGTFTDISGHSTEVSNTTQSRMTAETAVFGDDTPIITPGKRQAFAPTFSGVYTEQALDAYLKAEAIFREAGCDGGRICVRWSPAGGNVGDMEYEIRCGIIQDFDFPMGAAGDAAPVPWSFSVFTDEIYRDVIAS